jgi:hypothetical protein
MGVVEIVLLILAMKIPIAGLFWLVWWAGHPPETADGPGAEERSDYRPRRPEPPHRLGPRHRGPHGGAAAPAPAQHSSGGRTRAPSRHMPRRIPQTARGD